MPELPLSPDTDGTLTLKDIPQDLLSSLFSHTSATLLYTSEGVAEDKLKTLEKGAPGEWKKGDIIVDLYEVTDVLGEGAFGTVYKVRHRLWNKELAVKTLRPELASLESYRKSFIKECTAWVNLGIHPAIVSCYYVRDLGGLPRIFLEYVEGGSLADSLKKKKIECLRTILDLSIQCLAGLSFAHSKGLVHRDIKPLNCLLTNKGELKITDFGIALEVTLSERGEEKKENVTEGATGTPAYMPPEQWTRDCGQIGPWSDIYAFGIMLYEMCCGRRPFDEGGAPTVVMKARHLTEKPVEPAEFNRDIPEALSGFILKCLEKKPEDRFPGAEEAKDRLGEIYKDITGENYSRVFPREIDLVADGLNNRAVSLMDLGLKEEALKVWEKALSADHIHLRSTFNRGLILWRSGEIDDLSMLESLGNIEIENPSLWETYYFTALVHMERRDFPAAEKYLNRALEYTDDKKLLPLLDLAKNNINNSCRSILTFEKVRNYMNLTWNQDAGIVLLTEGNKIRVLNISSGKIINTIEENYEFLKSLSVSPDGKFCLAGRGDGIIKLWNISSGALVRTLAKHNEDVTCLAVSADGKLAASGGYDKIINLWDLAEGKCIKEFRGHNSSPKKLYITPDKKIILSGDWDGEIRVWDILTGECLRSFGDKNFNRSMHFSSDGKRAISTGDKGVVFWDVTKGSHIKTFKTHHRGDLEIAGFSPDLTWALTTGRDKISKLWNTHTGRCLRTLTRFGLHALLGENGEMALRGADVHTIELWKIGVSNFNSFSPLALSPVMSTEDTGGIQGRYYRLIEEADRAVYEKNYAGAIRLLTEIRNLPGYERKPEAIEKWESLYSFCKKTELHSIWTVKTFRQQGTYLKPLKTEEKILTLSGSGLNKEKTLTLSDISTGEPLRTFHGNWRYQTSSYITSDGTLLLTGHSDSFIYLWDIFTGKCLKTFKGHCGTVLSVALSRDRRLILSGGDLDCMVNLWDVNSGRLLRTFQGHRDHINTVLFSDDSQYAFSGGGSSDKTIRIWHVPTGKCVKTLAGHGHGIRSLSLSADGRLLLSGSGDKSVKLWDVTPGKCIKTFYTVPEENNPMSQRGQVDSVFLSPDGARAFAACMGGLLKIWNTSTGECIKTLEEEGDVKTVILTPDTSLLITCSSGYQSPFSTIKIWKPLWSLAPPESDVSDRGIIPCLENFLNCHTPYLENLPEGREPSDREITLALTRHGKPEWTEEDFKELVKTLGYAGYGWMEEDKIMEKLKELADKSNSIISKVFDFFKGNR